MHISLVIARERLETSGDHGHHDGVECSEIRFLSQRTRQGRVVVTVNCRTDMVKSERQKPRRFLLLSDQASFSCALNSVSSRRAVQIIHPSRDLGLHRD